MVTRCVGFLVLFVCVLLGEMRYLKADTTQNFAVWDGVFLSRRLTDQFSLYIENQIRLSENVSPVSRFMLRPAVQYFLKPDLSLWLGYAWLPNMSPFRNENRIWQQVQHVLKSESFLLVNRFRFEQRFIANTNTTSLRMRYLLRGLIPVTQDLRKTSICLWDEFFYSLNSVTFGPPSGFDQNRAFVGLNFTISNEVALEPGYLNVYDADSLPTGTLMSHTFVTYIYINI